MRYPPGPIAPLHETLPPKAHRQASGHHPDSVRGKARLHGKGAMAKAIAPDESLFHTAFRRCGPNRFPAYLSLFEHRSRMPETKLKKMSMQTSKPTVLGLVPL